VRGLATLNRIGYVPGLRSVLTAPLFKSFPKMLQGEVPPDHVGRLAAEMASNDRAAIRLNLRGSYEYLYRHGTIAGRLCGSGVPAEIVFGENDEVGITPAERSELESCSTTRLHFVPDCGHMLINQKPGWVANLIADVCRGSAGAPDEPRHHSMPAAAADPVKDPARTPSG
jgi:pimeloyl-ACP methyl ester carboxylesterase